MMTLKLSWHALCFSTRGLWKQLLTCQQPSGCSLIPLLCPFTRCLYPYSTLWICFSQPLISLSYGCATYMYAIILPVASCFLSLQLQSVTSVLSGCISLHCEAHLMVAVCACLRSRCCWTPMQPPLSRLMYNTHAYVHCSLISRPHALCIPSRTSTAMVS